MTMLRRPLVLQGMMTTQWEKKIHRMMKRPHRWDRPTGARSVLLGTLVDAFVAVVVAAGDVVEVAESVAVADPLASRVAAEDLGQCWHVFRPA